MVNALERRVSALERSRGLGHLPLYGVVFLDDGDDPKAARAACMARNPRVTEFITVRFVDR